MESTADTAIDSVLATVRVAERRSGCPVGPPWILTTCHYTSFDTWTEGEIGFRKGAAQLTRIETTFRVVPANVQHPGVAGYVGWRSLGAAVGIERSRRLPFHLTVIAAADRRRSGPASDARISKYSLEPVNLLTSGRTHFWKITGCHDRVSSAARSTNVPPSRGAWTTANGCSRLGVSTNRSCCLRA